jgi:predicted alpha/beta-hydrolase family hydrolase
MPARSLKQSDTGGFSAFQQGSIRGFLHEPLSPSGSGLVLTHGAGGNCESALLVAVAKAFAEAGISVLRIDLPFRQKKRFGPPSPATASHDREGLREAVSELRSRLSGPVFLGGQSYGGRQATILASETTSLVEGLVLLSYPLHAPGKPNDLRTSHFPSLSAPALFAQGTKDPFGSLEEMRKALELIPAPTKLVPIEGAGHDLKRGDFPIRSLIVDEFLTLINK